jgi:hypothetical protein
MELRRMAWRSRWVILLPVRKHEGRSDAVAAALLLSVKVGKAIDRR